MKTVPDKSRERWGVVGGGFLGMTLALRLAQQGKSVTLFETADFLGGLAGAWQLGDVVWDRHYHVILNSDSFLRALLRELNLEDDIQWTTTRTGFYVESRFYSLSNTLEFLRFPPLGFTDKLRLGATIYYASRIKNWKQLEKTPVEAWLERWSGRRVVNKIWLPLLRAKLGESYRETSAAFIWATIARMYAARRSGMKRELFGYVSGGYASIVNRFAQALSESGVQLRLGRPVRSVVRTNPMNANTAKLRIERGSGEWEMFDHVVVTAAAPLAAKLCPELSPEERSRLSGIKHQGIICASLLLKQPLGDFYVTNITDSQVPYTAVIEMSALADRKYFGGNALVYLPKYVASDSFDLHLRDELVKERFLSGLEQMYPKFRRSHVLAFQISRVKYLLPLSTLHYSDNLPSISTSIAGLHIVNSAHIVNGTLNVNQTVQLAESVARTFANPQVLKEFVPQVASNEIQETDCQPLAGSRQ
jgi:protoporphyrinogen oxidase